ncbi:uncharacterized protein RSE6_02687 [Rhynchosporium secalis]|uniref:Uncharacterized protein n=1 Tax=Rhynchosporium secalis TaxID=38038 RepID=A0A1E1M0W5_RHYSE|nr:uncharacterized protein RSE6_02687 [Rhynchosporium secalis]
MPINDIDYDELIKTLTDNFSVLAEEVQLLSDRKQILEHKLRFAHEQFQHLADKYSSGDAEISNTLAKLQLPPDLQVLAADRGGVVPLPHRTHISSKQQTAEAIRDGRRAAQRLSALTGRSTGSTVSGRSISGTSSNVRYSGRRTSLSTVLEQDFTVQGKKSSLLCPFSDPARPNDASMGPEASPGSYESNQSITPSISRDPARHQSLDPICAALYSETMNSPPPSASGSGAKCPIRYMDQHSPEEIAQYFEIHKHEIPRSHEVCVKRYQRNEDDIRKLDAKYGNLVSMIQGLGQKHQPMLPTKEEEEAMELEKTSNERVENWASTVSANGIGLQDHVSIGAEEDRETRFDRPLREIRLGESPSRPWGISVPILDPHEDERPVSPPAAPVPTVQTPRPKGKCPFGHVAKFEENNVSPPASEAKVTGICPFPHAAGAATPKMEQQEAPEPTLRASPVIQSRPTFMQPSELQRPAGGPQMIFTGPVFIGYPMEQAITFMQQYKGTQ